MKLTLFLLAPLSLANLLRSSASVPAEAFSPSLHLLQPKRNVIKLGYRVHSPLDNIAKDTEVSNNQSIPRHLPQVPIMSLGYILPLALPAAFIHSGVLKVLNDDVTTFFAFIGVAGSMFAVTCIAKLLISLKYESNFASALLPAPPRDAFANKVVLITGASSGVVSVYYLSMSPVCLYFSHTTNWISITTRSQYLIYQGRALALHLSSKHDNVKLILASRRQDALEEVAAECKMRGAGDAKILAMDLSEHASLPSKTNAALSMYDCGRVDILVNNGGVSTRSMARNSSFDVDTFVTDV